MWVHVDHLMHVFTIHHICIYLFMDQCIIYMHDVARYNNNM